MLFHGLLTAYDIFSFCTNVQLGKKKEVKTMNSGISLLSTQVILTIDYCYFLYETLNVIIQVQDPCVKLSKEI